MRPAAVPAAASALVNQVFLYCMACAVECSGVQVVASVALSNHWHAIVTDIEGRLPEFMACLNRLVGKCINTALDRGGATVKTSGAARQPPVAEVTAKTWRRGNPSPPFRRATAR